jgi:hypothetical protein
MGWGVEFTEPALLAGLWILLAMREALQEYNAADLQALADWAVAGPQAPNSG